VLGVWEADIRVGQVMEYARADDLVERPAELTYFFDREPMEIEVSQAIFSLKIACVTHAGFADVDCRQPSIGLAQSMDGSLGRSATGDQDLSICLRLLRWPHQQGQCSASTRVAVELAVAVEVAQRRRIGVSLVKSAHCVGQTDRRWRSRHFPGHLRLVAPSRGRPRRTRTAAPGSLELRVCTLLYLPEYLVEVKAGGFLALRILPVGLQELSDEGLCWHQ